MKNENLEVVVNILDRADTEGLIVFDRMSLFMDLEETDKKFNLRFEDLLNASNPDFIHEICGIQGNFNRIAKKMGNLFIPRFSGKEDDTSLTLP